MNNPKRSHHKKPCLAHHWLIEPVRGPTSKAVCRDCRAKRVFSNLEPTPTYVSHKSIPWGVTPKGGTGL